MKKAVVVPSCLTCISVLCLLEISKNDKRKKGRKRKREGAKEEEREGGKEEREKEISFAFSLSPAPSPSFLTILILTCPHQQLNAPSPKFSLLAYLLPYCILT